MPSKPSIAIIGPGRLGGAVAIALSNAGFQVREIVHSGRPAAARNAVRLARTCHAGVRGPKDARLDAEVIWFCVPDGAIAGAAKQFAKTTNWQGRIALHASGALTGEELNALRKRGAAVASLHPLMTFVARSQPALSGVTFAVEGDARAVRAAKGLVRGLGGELLPIGKSKKSAYHAWGAFTSPLLIALLVTAEVVARTAGISPREARRRVLPILRQTLENYARLGPADAFSGPIVRGDEATLRRHLQALESLPAARGVYLALARIAVERLPARRKAELKRLLQSP
jgi:predicted short-subunit dehydrogenase-like oxidoreductase (DUF2520 family)